MEFKNDKEKLLELANLMNDQSETPVIVTDDLAYVIDASLEPEEVDFLLQVGGGNLTRSQIESKVNLPKLDVQRLMDVLQDKGHMAELSKTGKEGEPVFHLRRQRHVEGGRRDRGRRRTCAVASIAAPPRLAQAGNAHSGRRGPRARLTGSCALVVPLPGQA